MISMFDLYQKPLLLVSGILIISLWTILWKGTALWFSAKHKQKGWFIVLLVFNTLGILPIIYLIWNKPKENGKKYDKKPKVEKKELIKKKSKAETKKTIEPKEKQETKPIKQKIKKTKIQQKTEKKKTIKPVEGNDEMSMQL